MFELKTLSRQAIPAALKKAERYRLLNEPTQAASICLDILQIEADHQEALILLLLAHTDTFKEALYPAFSAAEELLEKLNEEHCRSYYRGIIYERRARAHMGKGGPGSGELAYDWFRKAMIQYEHTLEICAPGNQDATLRWNTCARTLNDHPDLKPGDRRSPVELTDGYE